MGSAAITRFFLCVVVVVSGACAGFAQDVAPVPSTVLVVDSDRVFRASQAGQKINADLEERLSNLVAENRRIESELVAEELALTEQRAKMDLAGFRELADAFDEKVQGIRAAQDAKQRELQKLRENQNQTFSEALTPILASIGRERGALLILERRMVLLSADTIDVTEEAILRINATSTAQPNPASVQDVPQDDNTPEEQTAD